jgi:hypothetical protein
MASCTDTALYHSLESLRTDNRYNGDAQSRSADVYMAALLAKNVNLLDLLS